jgi:predicted ATPase/DNA-binding CsgD family transcriptional regulator
MEKSLVVGAGVKRTVNVGNDPPARALPIAPTTLIGRARDLEIVTQHLRRARLLTLTGAGGVGKTRLALEVARRRTVRADSGVWLVDLVTVAPGADVASETARILHIDGVTGVAAREALSRSLGDRHALLVLDNCEHVIEGCAELASALLGACPNLRLLATSREVLGVPGEFVVPVDPLAAEDARRLFVERAARRRPGFVPAEDDDEAIAALCWKLDRLPLAIELAAARVNAMSPTEISASLDERRLQLGGGRRLAPAHHRTVRATVEWSYRLLDLDEQRGFRGLGAFVGSFDAAAAEAVANLGVDVLARLVDKSLVTVVETRARGTRYRLLETVRELAAGLLVEAGEVRDALARHLHHFSSKSEPTPGWPSRVAERVVASLGEDYGNVRAALEWAATNDPCGGLRLLAGTGDLFSMLGHADGWRLAVELLQRCAERDRYRVMVQITAGVIGFQHGPLEVSQAVLAEAAELAAEIGQDGLRGWAVTFLGLTDVLAGRVESGRGRLESAQRIHRDQGEPIGEARATGVLGLAYAIDGDYERARQLVDAALATCIAEGDRWGQGHLHTYLGIISERFGDEAAATRHNRTAIECFRPFRDSSLLPTALASQASVIARRDPARALKVVAAARAIKARVGSDFPPFFRERADQVRAAAESALGADAAALWKEGFGLDRDEAIALAFGMPASRPSTVSGLSGREQEVARLVADGLANKEIAARLYLSVRTVETHIRHVLTKLGLLNRTQLATWARDRLG